MQKKRKPLSVCINARFFTKAKAKISVFDRGLLYGDGIFDTIPAANNKIFWLEDHIERLFRGCKKLKIKIPWSKNQIINLIKTTYRKNHQTKFEKIKIILTRGVNPHSANIENILSCKPNLIIYCIENKLPSKKQYQQGIKLLTIETYRPFPQLKSLSYIVSVVGQLKAQEKGFYDAVFANEQKQILEGTSFNIVAVRHGRLEFASKGALPGVTAHKVLELARRLGYIIKKTTLSLKQIPYYDEVFITGSTKKILPVIQINQEKVGHGKVGPITKKLMTEFDKKFF